MNTREILDSMAPVSEERQAEADGRIRNAEPREVKQTMRRAKILGEAMTSALTNRVEANTEILRVSFKDFMRMKDDPEFHSFASYVGNLVNYADGRPRPRPIRPLLKNEMGMYRGKVVVMAGDSPDGEGSLISAVTADIGDKT